jgi:hypothetical protein
MIDRAEASNNRADTERTKARRDDIAQGIAQEVAHTGGEVGGLNDPEFHNYKPPRRLLALEIIVIILLIMLLLINPNGLTAISMKGTDTVGLLSSCSGGTCTSWLGAPAGGEYQLTSATQANVRFHDGHTSSSSTSTSRETCPIRLHIHIHLRLITHSIPPPNRSSGILFLHPPPLRIRIPLAPIKDTTTP